MHVRLISTPDALTALESPWNELAGGMPFQSWDWLAGWWRHYGTGDSSSTRELRVIAIFAGDTGDEAELIGLAPFYVERSLARGNVLRLLGSGEVCTDHSSLICAAGDAEAIARQVAVCLTEKLDDWDALDLTAIDATDQAVAALAAALAERDCVVSHFAADACWVVELPGSWEEYLSLQSKSHRKQLRRLEHRVIESDRTRWHQVEKPDQFAEGWNTLVELHQRRRRSLGEPGCFASRPFRDFHRDVAERMLARGQLRLSWLELDGAPVAAEYHLAGRQTTFAYQGGLDPDRLAEEPGRLSTILCLQAAIAEQHRTFDFLRGDEPYKAHWRATPHPTVDYRIVPNRRLARLRGRAMQLSGTMSEWVKSGANLISNPTSGSR